MDSVELTKFLGFSAIFVTMKSMAQVCQGFPARNRVQTPICAFPQLIFQINALMCDKFTPWCFRTGA